MSLTEIQIKSFTFYSKCLLVGGIRVINSQFVLQAINTFSLKHGSFEISLFQRGTTSN